jgi:dienelactone hydrolase
MRALALSLLLSAAGAAVPDDVRVVLESDGWELVGEWRVPPSVESFPAVLLLHRAAGSRAEYAELASALVERGVGSLRLDLRAHGESVTRGRFVEPFAENRGLLDGTHRDVARALQWIRAQPGVTPNRVAAVGASYSGEAIGQALRGDEPVSACVILSPGSFSDESIAHVDESGAAWLFIRSREESEASLPFIDAVFTALEQGSETAEIRVLDGAGHGTHLFDSRPDLAEEIAEWLSERLGG